MLELKDIHKEYPAGDGKVEALKGINLQFRNSEFVSILGPSGCGKTTMLNIIGGLDGYTSGDLLINGISTKKYKDRDWDTYRNHSVGFVFQSYNLIPHQTVLQNVELALTLSGVSKHERRERAKKALEEVGLADQLKKRPSEMSGGQMQRVAIARALVNNPDIILADEPTGALDTETSVQVMNILKKISENRLIIMVTHNPDLAEEYSTRIVRMLDGVIKSDTNPLTEEEIKSLSEKDTSEYASRLTKKPTMKFSTSFGLSLKNLMTKRGRTILTSFAGSIGIIGIALIYSVSNGMTTYIDKVQEDTLSSYPLTLEAQHISMGSLLETFMGHAESHTEHENDAIYQKSMLYDLVNTVNSIEADENDLTSFKYYIENELSKGDNEELKEAITGIHYNYSTNLQVYTKNVDGKVVKSDAQEMLGQIIAEYIGADMSGLMNFGTSTGLGSNMTALDSIGGMGGSSMNIWQEMLPGKDGKIISPILEGQYDVIYGSWPDEYDEVVVVVDSKNELDDMTLYALGLKSKEEIDETSKAAIEGTVIELSGDKWSYEEVCGMKFRTVLNSSCYTYDEDTGTYTDLRNTDAGIKYLYDNGIELRISGIIRPREDAVSTMLTGTIAYTSELTKYILENAEGAESVKAQLADEKIDIFTGLPFRENTGNMSEEEKVAEFKSYINSLSDKDKAAKYLEIMCIPSDEMIDGAVKQTLSSMSREDMNNTMVQVLTTQMGMAESEVKNYIENMPDEDMEEIFSEMIAEQTKTQYAAGVMEQMAMVPDEQKVMMLTQAMETFTNEQMAKYHDEVLEFSDSTFDNNLKTLGYIDLEKPTAINIYASSFENKDIIEDAIIKYNNSVDELSQITYTDYVGLMMSSITTIINAITYVLIAFVAISLIVSSIMIGVITLISVQERTKEIGILRAIGASKKDVSSMFNAETMIVGFTSGLIGVVTTYILCIPINIILYALTDIVNLKAIFPIEIALILTLISVGLTLISGIIPSRSAAKKDPVVALRTE